MLTDNQILELKKKLNPNHVKVRPDSGMSYIEGWLVEDEANSIFNFAWDSEVLELTENTLPTKNHKGNNVVSFRAKVRITTHGIVKEGIGYGSGISKDIHAAYEGAIKEAETDAEKRAFKKFGNRFGLALYDKKQANVGVDELTAEEKLVMAKEFTDKYLKELNPCADENIVNLENTHAKWLQAIDSRYPELSKQIKDATATKRKLAAELLKEFKEAE